MSYEAYRRTLTPVVQAVYRVEVRGQENVPLSGRLVVAGNHDSMLDPLLLAAVIPRPIRYLGKAELWKVPGFGWLKERTKQHCNRRGSCRSHIREQVAAASIGHTVLRSSSKTELSNWAIG